MSSVADALAMAKAANVERLDSQLLLGHVLARPRAWLIAHDDAMLNDAQMLAWRSLLARRLAGEPVAYLVGFKEFHGLTFRVEPGVLIPRPDTEVLVDWALERLGALGTPMPRVAAAPQVGAPPVVWFGDPLTGVEQYRFLAYDLSFRGGVRLAVGDVTGDGVPDLVTGAGPGGGPHVEVFDGRTDTVLTGFLAFPTTYTAGIAFGTGFGYPISDVPWASKAR